MTARHACLGLSAGPPFYHLEGLALVRESLREKGVWTPRGVETCILSLLFSPRTKQNTTRTPTLRERLRCPPRGKKEPSFYHATGRVCANSVAASRTGHFQKAAAHSPKVKEKIFSLCEERERAQHQKKSDEESSDLGRPTGHRNKRGTSCVPCVLLSSSLPHLLMKWGGRGDARFTFVCVLASPGWRLWTSPHTRARACHTSFATTV